jgi:hypothetical protein
MANNVGIGGSYGSATGLSSSFAASGSGVVGGSAAGVSKDVLRNLQDVVWSDDEVSFLPYITTAITRPRN